MWRWYELSESKQITATELVRVSKGTFQHWCQRFHKAGATGQLYCCLGPTSVEFVSL
jgi:hypothetical protein